MTASVSIGIAAAAGADVAARIAPTVERAGFHALWVNDTPGADALEVLAAAAAVTERLVLATGVLPADRRSAAEISARVAALGLPEERLVLGIGSGSGGAVGALVRVADAASALRAGSEARVVVGALGPKMRRLGATVSDGVLLSWLTPDAARAQAREAHETAAAAHVALYVRAAADVAAVGRLDVEAERYAGYPSYAANFARLGIAARDTVLRPDGFAAGLAEYRAAVDEVVLRAIVPGDDAADYLAFVEAAAAAH
ncbi:LLM class flavin-dependent oxidoreductase [Microbacterium sp. NPDC058389]|uniref:LLM class flavin-dependent oxidoreductase n=1 Tax=Microbacterium sp. NPDC058389 TaxID=3346475 RepID=UPI00364EFE9D